MVFRKKKYSVKANFEKFLKDYNCKYTVEKDEETGATYYNFEFQAGHFVGTVRRQDDCIDVTYPTMATVPIAQLPLVRSKCNDRNNSNILFKFTYSIDHEETDVNVHMSFFNNMVDNESMVNQLKAAFHFQREWQRDFDEAVSISKDYNSIDLESELYNHHREMFLLRRTEVTHEYQTGKLRTKLYGNSSLSLIDLINTVHPIPGAVLVCLNMSAPDKHNRWEEAVGIKHFDLRTGLIEGKEQQAHFVREYALLDLHYRQGEDMNYKMATIMLTAEGDDEHALYTRVTITFPASNASRLNSLSNEERIPHCTSLLIAFDRDSGRQQREEFNYMWSDAHLKAKNGEQDKMTEDELMLCQVHQADIAYNLYWGQQCFNSERYYEAILHLENVYYSYRELFFEMSAEQKRTFLEVAYKLGFCYNELGLYKQAFYFLDFTGSDGNIRHTMELVNAMANGKDPRLFSYTEGVMEEVKRNFGQDDELPDNIRQFINFLRRRRGYAYINFNQLDQAEKIFTKMLDEEENADYAIKELAYIKELRHQRGEDMPELNVSDSNSPDAPHEPPF